MSSQAELYEAMELRPVINAAGKLTVLGASIVSTTVAETMAAAAQDFVDLPELMALADRRIAQATGAEAGFVTSCAAAGITIATAACLTRGDLARTEALPRLPSPPDEMIIQRGHAIHFGAAVIQMMALAGARVVEVGAANRTAPHQVRQEISERTAGIMYVISHHAASSGAVELGQVLDMAHEFDVPVVVDAAAELDLRKYIAAGVDLVIYSGHKGLNGPTSGIIAGRQDLIAACAQQNSAIGRTMKIGKENIAGCLAALRQYVDKDPEDYRDRAERLASGLDGITGLQTEIIADATRPTIVRLRLVIDPRRARLTAQALVERLEAHSPSIRTRNHGLGQGAIDLDFRTLKVGDEQIIQQALTAFLA